MSTGICCEQLVEIEDRRDLAAQIEQRRDDLLLGGGRGRQFVCWPSRAAWRRQGSV